jgi:hypothetical protein
MLTTPGTSIRDSLQASSTNTDCPDGFWPVMTRLPDASKTPAGGADIIVSLLRWV